MRTSNSVLYEELEVCNPLAVKQKHKLGKFLKLIHKLRVLNICIVPYSKNLDTYNICIMVRGRIKG